MLMLLARLGLRCGEVAGLTLDDLDWRAGELVVHGKRSRTDRLPLPCDVGEALSDYLKHVGRQVVDGHPEGPDVAIEHAPGVVEDVKHMGTQAHPSSMPAIRRFGKRPNRLPSTMAAAVSSMGR